MRYKTWLKRQPIERPMIGLLWEPDIPPLPEFLKQAVTGGKVRPECIQPQGFLPHIDKCCHLADTLPGDLIQRFTPAFGMPWMEAIAGSTVMANPDSLWAKPSLESLSDRPPIRLDSDNPWLRKLLEFTCALVEFAADRFPVAVPQMRGPLDTLAAMRTPEQMCIDLLEQPEAVFTILGELTDLWIAVGEAVLDAIPLFHGGYMARMGTWAPGPILTAQNDVSTLVSPKLYEELVLPWDLKIVEHFPHTEFHMHSTEHHQIDNLLRLDRLTTIEFTLEHTLGGPPLETTLPAARRILTSKPLILAALDIETAERCLLELRHEGLCMTIAVSGGDIPKDILQWLAIRDV